MIKRYYCTCRIDDARKWKKTIIIWRGMQRCSRRSGERIKSEFSRIEESDVSTLQRQQRGAKYARRTIEKPKRIRERLLWSWVIFFYLWTNQVMSQSMGKLRTCELSFIFSIQEIVTAMPQLFLWTTNLPALFQCWRKYHRNFKEKEIKHFTLYRELFQAFERQAHCTTFLS